MKMETFLMERMQSTWENRVEYNLSESGVHPMYLGELLREEPEATEKLLKQELGYPQSNGIPELRNAIAALYPGATQDHVLVTNGTSEANFLCTWALVEPDDEVLLMLPNYMQIWGLVRGFRGNLRTFQLREEKNWQLDLSDVERISTKRTKMIIVCNPNNPTGSVLEDQEMKGLIEIARRSQAWILADEVYLGAEREVDRTRSFWGQYGRVIVTNGLSKAYGLPGLRIGWIVAPPELIERLWSYHDYTTIGAGMLSNQLATIALQHSIRERILARTRKILQNNFPVLADWIQEHKNLFSMIDPKAGAIAYFRYNLKQSSTELVERLRDEKSVLIVPGDHFGMDRYLRVGYGSPPEYLSAGLNRVSDLLNSL
jgi:aspartate/methionine/tyrosine aminotransferase